MRCPDDHLSDGKETVQRSIPPLCPHGIQGHNHYSIIVYMVRTDLWHVCVCKEANARGGAAWCAWQCAGVQCVRAGRGVQGKEWQMPGLF